MKYPGLKVCAKMITTNNRELSWLAFNDRVLQEARDPSVPLMQRLRPEAGVAA